MDSNDQKERRVRVQLLLGKCIDEKVLIGGTERAKQAAKDAHELATRSPALPAPWPQLAAYRLAHLILRSKPGIEELHEADRLLAQASGSEHNRRILGPLPVIYRLAVIHRLHLQEGSENTERLLEKTFESAKEAVKAYQTKPPALPADPEKQAQIQDGLTNMLELSACFLGMGTDRLEGWSDPWSDLGLGPNAYGLITKERGRDNERRPLALVEAELEDLAVENPSALLLDIRTGKASWKLGPKPPWEDLNEDAACLIRCLLENLACGSDELRKLVVGDEGENPGDRFRQIKHRLKTGFRELVKGKGELIVEKDDGSSGLRINPEVQVFCLLEAQALYTGKQPSRRS